jgi:hypothetical protein
MRVMVEKRMQSTAQRVEELALISVGRGVGFAALAIGTFMIGMSADIMACVKSGGILTLITSLILWMRAVQAPRRDYRRTEVWIMMEPQDRPNSVIAQVLIGETLRRTYMTFAVNIALVSAGLLFTSLMISASGIAR